MGRLRAWLRWRRTAPVAVRCSGPAPPGPPGTATASRRHLLSASVGMEPGQRWTTDEHPATDEWTPTPGVVYSGLPPGWRTRR